MIWRADKRWSDQTAFILGGGPSLRGFDASVLKRPGWRVLAVNDSWRLAPWLDCLYFTDESWFVDQMQRDLWSLDRTINFGQLMYTKTSVNGGYSPVFKEHPQVRQLKFTGQEGLEKSPEGLRHGSSSCYAAMNLAYHFGVKRIVLLGMDMRVVDGRTHWHDSPRPDGYASVISLSHLPSFATLVEPLKEAGVEVLNATKDSALTCWSEISLRALIEPEGEQLWPQTHRVESV